MDFGIINTHSNNKKLHIPAVVRIGVTGHRELDNKQIILDSINNKVYPELKKTLTTLKHTPHTFTIISPLAEGADRLVAKEVMGWEVSKDVDKPTLKAVLPLPEDDYIQDFPESQNEFLEFIEKAESVQTLGKTESRIAAYEQVGRHVVDNCDVLIAIWDGKPAAGQGGTAEIVKYALFSLNQIFQSNYRYKKAGVIVDGLQNESCFL